MMKLHYAGGTTIVSDQLCAALFRYATALADGDQVGLATFPSVDDDGTTRRVQTLLGPTSNAWAIEVYDVANTLDDQAAVDELNSQTHKLAAGRTHLHGAPGAIEGGNLDFDLDLGLGLGLG